MPSLRQVILILAIVGAFGILVPLYKGLDFLDARLIVAYACLSAVIAAPIVTDALARAGGEQDAEQGGGPRLPGVLRAWLFSWVFAACLLALALGTVNATHRFRGMILPRPSFLIAAECLSLTLAGAVAGLGALLASRFPAENVRAGFRAVFLLAAAGLFIADRYGALAMGVRSMTRLLFILSALLGAAALALHVMLRDDDAHSRNRRGAGGV